MKKIKVAINGFGRIGRLSLRALLKKNNVTITAINDLASPTTLAYLLKYDSNFGCFAEEVICEGGGIIVAGNEIKVYAEKDPTQLPWRSLGIDTVLESTGRFTHEADAEKHLAAGAQKVIISAPAKGNIPTVVLGVNDYILTGKEKIISNASCTTNCLAPMVKVLNDEFGIERGYINTIHAYTSDQTLQDAPHRDLRRARSAAQSVIPTSTGAAKAIGLVIPALKGKLDGIAMRVPVANGSVTDFTALLTKKTTQQVVNEVMKCAAESTLKGILEYTEAPIVSVDVISNPHSCIFDAPLTMVSGHLVKVVGWYDNEGAYAHRIADLINLLATL